MSDEAALKEIDVGADKLKAMARLGGVQPSVLEPVRRALAKLYALAGFRERIEMATEIAPKPLSDADMACLARICCEECYEAEYPGWLLSLGAAKKGPVLGDIWFSKSSFDSDGYAYKLPLRVPLLVIAGPHPAGRHEWLYAAPILLGADGANVTLSLGASDSSLGREFGVLLRRQARISTSQLDNRLGSLSAEGLSQLETCLTAIPPEHSGIRDRDSAVGVGDAFRYIAGFHWHLREADPDPTQAYAKSPEMTKDQMTVEPPPLDFEGGDNLVPEQATHREICTSCVKSQVWPCDICGAEKLDAVSSSVISVLAEMYTKIKALKGVHDVAARFTKCLHPVCVECGHEANHGVSNECRWRMTKGVNCRCTSFYPRACGECDGCMLYAAFGAIDYGLFRDDCPPSGHPTSRILTYKESITTNLTASQKENPERISPYGGRPFELPKRELTLKERTLEQALSAHAQAEIDQPDPVRAQRTIRQVQPDTTKKRSSASEMGMRPGEGGLSVTRSAWEGRLDIDPDEAPNAVARAALEDAFWEADPEEAAQLQAAIVEADADKLTPIVGGAWSKARKNREARAT